MSISTKRILILLTLALFGATGAFTQDALFIDANGNVGINNSTPAEELDIKSKGAGDVFRVTRSFNSSSIFRLFQTANGDGLFSLFNEIGREAFRLTSVAGGRLAVGCVTPQHDLDLSDNPGFACDAGSARSFIDAGQTQFTVSSSRSIKKNLEPFAGDGILDRISAIPVFSYDFIQGPSDQVGLMAEDFFKVFGRGSNATINGHEVQLALWLAVQELHEQNKGLAKQNSELRVALEAIQATLATQLTSDLAASP